MYGAQVLLTLGSGLFINLSFEKSITKLVIYQIITGVGVGFNMEPPLLVAQATATALDTAAVISTMSFLRSISTAIIVVIGGVIFQGQMVASNSGLSAQIGKELAAHFNGEHATANVEFIATLPRDVQDVIRRVYFQSLRAVWIMVGARRITLCRGRPVDTVLVSLVLTECFPTVRCCCRHFADLKHLCSCSPFEFRDKRSCSWA